MQRTIAIVEDEPALRENYADFLTREGYQVRTYSDRAQALTGIRAQMPDIALLDIRLESDLDGGFEICRELRSLSATIPIIFLTARDNDMDRISGLRLGADDYLSKDISLVHLTARITALFNRIEAYSKAPQQEQIIHRGPLQLDLHRYVAWWKEHRVDLTLTEFWMVHSLALHVGHVKNRDQLMDEANTVVDEATITSHIKRIRNKFKRMDSEFDHIETVYGLGYRWIERA
jgi:two-component system OmpR family response regulator